MNTYGARAMTHWQRWLPSRYQAIEDPSSFFTDLGEQIADLIAAGCLEWESRDRPELNGLEYLARVGRLNAIKASVTEQVMADLALLEPEPQTLEPDQPLTEFPGVMRPDGMPVDLEHRLHRMEDDPDVSTQEFMTALHQWRASLVEESPSTMS